MKRQIRKHPFNMVEIALAMAIIAIGLSGILVLFPVGINASKSAIADNNLADIAEYIMGYLQAGCNTDWIKLAENPPGEGTSATYPFADALPTSASTVGDSGVTLNSNGQDATNFPNPVPGNNATTANLFAGSNGTFLYRQMSNDVVDFAAIVKVWRENINFYVPQINTDAVTSPHLINNSLPQYARNLCLEISWPIELPYADREKRIFRLEIFNQAYEIPATTTP